MLVAVEGLDGAGKTSIVEALAERLEANGNPVLKTREPRFDLRCGLELESLLRSGDGGPSPIEIVRLFGTNRLDHATQVIEPFEADDSRNIVLSDRNLLSALAYQAIDGVTYDAILRENAGSRIPDVTIFVDTDPDVCKQRVAAREGIAERYERDFERTRQHFLAAIDFVRDKGWDVVFVNGNQRDMEPVLKRAIATITRHIGREALTL